MTIPIALLWRVRIDIRRKFALGTTLCLSVFTIVASIIKVSGGKTVNNQIDSSWVVFWLQMEAAVAVMVVSVTTFRALFVAERSQKQDSPRYTTKIRAKKWYGSEHSEETKASSTFPTTATPNLDGKPRHYDEERSLRAGQQPYTALGHSRDPSQVMPDDLKNVVPR